MTRPTNAATPAAMFAPMCASVPPVPPVNAAFALPPAVVVLAGATPVPVALVTAVVAVLLGIGYGAVARSAKAACPPMEEEAAEGASERLVLLAVEVLLLPLELGIGKSAPPFSG